MNETEKKPAVKKPTKKPKKMTRKEKNDIMRSLGLTPVRGAVSGRWYYE